MRWHAAIGYTTYAAEVLAAALVEVLWLPPSKPGPQSWLLEDVAQRTRWNVGARFARRGDLARLGRVPVLAVAAALGGELSAVLFQETDHLSDFHAPESHSLVALPARVLRRQTHLSSPNVAGGAWKNLAVAVGCFGSCSVGGMSVGGVGRGQLRQHCASMR
jgi:hypothetical protein